MLVDYDADWLVLDDWVFDYFNFDDNPTQLFAWERAIAFNNKREGQYLAHFFLDEEYNLHFETMVATVDELLGDGCMDPFFELTLRGKTHKGPYPRYEDGNWFRCMQAPFAPLPIDFEEWGSF